MYAVAICMQKRRTTRTTVATMSIVEVSSADIGKASCSSL